LATSWAIALGTNTLSPQVFAGLIALFPDGVQVNAVGSHCYSGTLVEAVASSN
jgi:hypothetical protein